MYLYIYKLINIELNQIWIGIESIRGICQYPALINTISRHSRRVVNTKGTPQMMLLSKIISQISHLWGSMTVRMLYLKVTSKSRHESSLLGLGNRAVDLTSVLYSTFFISCYSSESVRCVELSWCVCVIDERSWNKSTLT